MNTLPPPLPRNPITARLHRRDTAWQIYVPLGVAGLAVVAVVGLAILAANTGQAAVDSAFADVSLIFLIVIAAAIAIVPLALLAGLAAGLWYALRYLPGYARVAQNYTAEAARIVRQAADRAAAPIIAANGATAAVRGGWRKATERKAKR